MSGRQSHIKQVWKVSTAMGKDTYIHGIGSAEQERLTLQVAELAPNSDNASAFFYWNRALGLKA